MAKETHIKTDKKTVGGWGAWELRNCLVGVMWLTNFDHQVEEIQIRAVILNGVATLGIFRTVAAG